jgi:phosphohistidine phosphatase SixA
MRDELVADTRDVLVVGHMPHIGRLAALLAPGTDMPAHGAVVLTRDTEGFSARVVYLGSR